MTASLRARGLVVGCACLAVAAGCGSTGQDVVTFPLSVAGTGTTTFQSGAWDVTLERADVGFGPIWFCATPFADIGVCDQAGAEWLGTTTLDALDDGARKVGEANAVTGTVRSAIFDYGRSWLLTGTAPRPDDGSPGGHSARFVARATDGTRTLEVHADIDVDPAHAGQTAVIAAPTGTHTITGAEALTVRFDPVAWWKRVDFDALAALDDDDDGVVELTPPAGGTPSGADAGVPTTLDGGTGGHVAPSSDAYTTLSIRMTTRPPTFEWAQR